MTITGGPNSQPDLPGALALVHHWRTQGHAVTLTPGEHGSWTLHLPAGTYPLPGAFVQSASGTRIPARMRVIDP